jgi:hypothetical protein
MAEALKKIVDAVTFAKFREEKRLKKEEEDARIKRSREHHEEAQKYLKEQNARIQNYAKRFAVLKAENYLTGDETKLAEAFDTKNSNGRELISLAVFEEMIRRDKGQSVEEHIKWLNTAYALYMMLNIAATTKYLTNEQFTEAMAFLKDNLGKMEIISIENYLEEKYKVTIRDFSNRSYSRGGATGN